MTVVGSPVPVLDSPPVDEPATPERTRLRSDALTYAAAGFLLLVLLAALAGPMVAPHSATKVTLEDQMIPPVWASGGSADHLLGTDALGRDVVSRMLAGARVTLLVGLGVTVTAGLVGTLLGLIAGFRGGRWGTLIMRLADAQLAFPGLLLVVTVIAAAGPSVGVVVLVLSIYGWMIYTMVVRAVVLQVREALFVSAAEMAGAGTGRILRRHLLPRVVAPLLALVPLELSRVVIAESSLSYLGLGIQPPDASWGLMVAENQGYMSDAWWSVVFPGAALALTVLSLNLVASSVALRTDPRERQLAIAIAARKQLERRRARDRAGAPAPSSPPLGPPSSSDPLSPSGPPSSLDPPLLEVEGLAVDFHTERGVVHAVQDVSLSVRPGSTLAVVGESGSGKTVTALAALRLLPPTADMVAGTVRWKGERFDAAASRILLGRSATMVFQDPMQSLNPLVPVGRQVGEMLRKHKGLRGQELRHRVVELFEQVGIPQAERRIKQYPFEFSGGMAQRVAVVLITHDLGIVAGHADRVAVMYQGRIVEEATAYDLLSSPSHPYTRGLLESTPHPFKVRVRLPQLRGSAPAVPEVTDACAFRARCPSATGLCAARPALVAPSGEVPPEPGDERRVACWHAG